MQSRCSARGCATSLRSAHASTACDFSGDVRPDISAPSAYSAAWDAEAAAATVGPVGADCTRAAQ